MAKHPQAGQQETQIASSQAGNEPWETEPLKPNYPYNLWVSHQYRVRNGEPQRVLVAMGPGARPLRDVMLAILHEHCSAHGRCNEAAVAIRQVFEGIEEVCEPGRAVIHALDEAAEGIARARKLLE
jgi:hypothetical protein